MRTASEKALCMALWLAMSHCSIQTCNGVNLRLGNTTVCFGHHFEVGTVVHAHLCGGRSTAESVVEAVDENSQCTDKDAD